MALERPGTRAGAATPRLRATAVSKTFGATRALVDVELELWPGEIHGLVGQNGSGKSTLTKILTGYHAPDGGARLAIDGEDVQLPLSVTDLPRYGIAVVHQSLGLIREFTVLENMRVARLRGSRWMRRIRWAPERQQARRVFKRLGQPVELNRLVSELSPEHRATVGIARALQDHEAGKGVILLDEATRALTRRSLEHFYAVLRTVIDEGTSAVVVSHRLEEVLSVCDRVTVLRDGRVVAAGTPVAELDEARLTRLMLGYEQGVATRRRQATSTETVAELEDLSGGVVDGFGARIGRGEIVGITGLAGGGFEEVPYLIAGAVPAHNGVLRIGSDALEYATRKITMERLIDAGVFLVPEKRDEEGLALEMSVLDNLTLPRLGVHGSFWWAGTGWREREAEEMIRRLGIIPPRPAALVSMLSGGNQQKVLLGKWLAGSPRLLLLHEPTQGVDVGARRDILNVLRNEADRGCGVLVSSTDAGDLALMCDRVLVVRDGRLADELTGSFDADDIVHATFRAADRAPVGP